MILFPNAKVNLGLNVISERSDHYHNIQTVLYPVPLQDVLRIEEGTEDSFTLEGLKLTGPKEDNLVWKAYQLLKEEHAMPPTAFTLKKNIPMGAGLGGGSSDAAFTLKGLNKIYHLNLRPETLEEYAAKLGADCPFFIENRPRFASGLGYDFLDIDLDLTGYEILLVKPDISVSTAEAYEMVNPRPWDIPLKSLIKTPLEMWKGILVNDFEASLFNPHPELAILKRTLYDAGAIYSAMSGSGSTVFGLFKEGEAPDLAYSIAYKTYKKLL